MEKLGLHQVHGNVREHEKFPTAHLVTHRHGRTDHEVDLAAADQGPHVVDHGAAPHQHVREHGNLIDQGVFHNAVVDQAVVNSRRERNVAGQKKSAVKSGQADIAHKHGALHAGGVKIGLHQHTVPVLATVAVFFQGGHLFGGQVAQFRDRRLDGPEIFGQRRQIACLQHFFQLQQSLHALKID